MRASILTRPGSIALVEVEDPPCAEDEVVIRVTTCGVCGTDRSIFRGEYDVGLLFVNCGTKTAWTRPVCGVSSTRVAACTPLT